MHDPARSDGPAIRAPWAERIAWLAVLGVWLALTLPLAAGQRTFYFRDVFKTHLPLKAFGAAELAEGRVPALNPTLGLGQPFRGNPNALAFYPGNLLYLALPFFPAFNLHYALHWLLGLLGAHRLARTLGQSGPAALLAALAYGGGGWMLSALTFYNLVAVAAWWPWVLAGAARGGMRGTALGGLACGMALLAGEPVTAALGLLPLAIVALESHGARAWRVVSGVLATGVAVTLPQIVATLRVLPFTVRGSGGMAAEDAGLFSFHPLRLAELVVPFPFGLPGSFGPDAYWSGPWGDRIPFVLTLFAGAPALWLALYGERRRLAWTSLAVAGLAVAWAPAGLAGVVARLSGGLVRHPEKALFWTALALPLLAGWGLDRILAAPRARLAALAVVVTGALVLAVVGALAAPAIGAGVEARLIARGTPQDRAVRGGAGASAHWILRARGLAMSAGSLALAALAVRRRRALLVVGCQGLSLLALHPLWMTDAVAPYEAPPPLLTGVGRGPIVVAAIPDPPWEALPVPELGSRALIARWLAEQLHPAPGVLHGLSYPLPPDVDGMVSPLLSATEARLARAGWPERVAWSRRLGARALVVHADPPLPGLRRAPLADEAGAPAPHVYLLDGAASPEHRGGGRVRLLESSADRLLLETDGGGLVVLPRAYQELWQAQVDGGERRADLVPVDGLFLGVQVPSGRARVEVRVSAWPELLAAVVALLTVAAALACALRGGSGATGVDPAPAKAAR